MNILSLLIFVVLGVILGGVFSAPVEPPQPRKKSRWYTKPLDMLLRAVVLLGVIFSVNLFPLGIAGLFTGAILHWMMFDDGALAS